MGPTKGPSVHNIYGLCRPFYLCVPWVYGEENFGSMKNGLLVKSLYFIFAVFVTVHFLSFNVFQSVCLFVWSQFWYTFLHISMFLKKTENYLRKKWFVGAKLIGVILWKWSLCFLPLTLLHQWLNIPGGTQIWVGQGCAAQVSKPIPIFKGDFGQKGYPFLRIFREN